MAKLDTRGRAVLRAYRQAKFGPSEPQDALWARIEASLDEGALGPSIEPTPSPSSATLAPTTVGPTLVVAIAVAVAAIVVAALALSPEDRALASRPTPDQAPRAVVASEPGVATHADAAAESATIGTPPTSPSAAVVHDEPLDPSSASPRRRAPRRSDRDAAALEASDPEATQVDELRAELALIREARQALQADRPTGALEALDAHARAFPRGQMREDREVLRIEALCAAGKAPQARAEVQLFLRAYPRSAHAQRVRAMCVAP